MAKTLFLPQLFEPKPKATRFALNRDLATGLVHQDHRSGHPHETPIYWRKQMIKQLTIPVVAYSPSQRTTYNNGTDQYSSFSHHEIVWRFLSISKSTAVKPSASQNKGDTWAQKCWWQPCPHTGHIKVEVDFDTMMYEVGVWVNDWRERLNFLIMAYSW